MVGGVDGRLLHLRSTSHLSTTEGVGGISLFFSYALPDLVLFQAELEENMHCLLIGRRSLPFNPGWVDQAHNASRHAGNDLPFVALQPSVVPFGWKIDSQGN